MSSSKWAELPFVGKAPRGVALEVVHRLGIDAGVVLGEVVFLESFLEVVHAPVFAVEEHDGGAVALHVQAQLAHQALHEAIPHHGQVMIVPGGAEQQPVELGDGQVGENAVAEGLAALLVEGVQAQGLDGETERGVAMHRARRFPGRAHRAVGLEKLHVHGPLPERRRPGQSCTPGALPQT